MSYLSDDNGPCSASIHAFRLSELLTETGKSVERCKDDIHLLLDLFQYISITITVKTEALTNKKKKKKTGGVARM